MIKTLERIINTAFMGIITATISLGCCPDDCSSSQCQQSDIVYEETYKHDTVQDVISINPDITDKNDEKENIDIKSKLAEECNYSIKQKCSKNKQKIIYYDSCTDEYEIIECPEHQHCWVDDIASCVDNINCLYYEEHGFFQDEELCCTEGSSGEKLCLIKTYHISDYCNGIIWDGESLCIIDSISPYPFIHKMTTLGEEIEKWPAIESDDIAYDGTNYWTIQDNVVYKLNDRFEELEEIIVKDNEIVGNEFQLRGITWDGNNLWVVKESLAYSGGYPEEISIHKIDENGKSIHSFYVEEQKVRGLEWKFEDNSLWYADSKQDVMYNVDTNGIKLNSFPSPVYWNRGIAWQDEYLWTVYNFGEIAKMKMMTE